MGQTALAGYQPPKDQKPPAGHSDSSGVRGGCKTSSGRSPIMFAPAAHIKQPNYFAWFVTDHQPVAIQFKLYEFDISTTNNPFVEANIDSEADIEYVANHKDLLPTRKEAIDKVFTSFLTRVAKLKIQGRGSI
ncbi:hypothetical protein JYQ62_20680 [Nostoc sp. UHCC 0702]|nr:hypothetical protein JYQ62_20680 [Nostoc sp. UHCC 0702]